METFARLRLEKLHLSQSEYERLDYNFKFTKPGELIEYLLNLSSDDLTLYLNENVEAEEMLIDGIVNEKETASVIISEVSESEIPKLFYTQELISCVLSLPNRLEIDYLTKIVPDLSANYIFSDVFDRIMSLFEAADDNVDYLVKLSFMLFVACRGAEQNEFIIASQEVEQIEALESKITPEWLKFNPYLGLEDMSALSFYIWTASKILSQSFIDISTALRRFGNSVSAEQYYEELFEFFPEKSGFVFELPIVEYFVVDNDSIGLLILYMENGGECSVFENEVILKLLANMNADEFLLFNEVYRECYGTTMVLE